jgi:hypothetical protein
MKRVLATAALVGVGLLGTSLPAALAQSGDDGGGSGQNCQVSGSDDDYSQLTVNIQRSSGGSDDDCGTSGPGGNEGPGGGYEEPPYEEPPYEEPPVEQPPYEQPPYEQPPVEQPPYEQPPVEQPPYEQPPVEQPPVVTPIVKPVVKPPAVTPVPAAPVVQPAPVVAAPVPSGAANAGFNVQTAAEATAEADTGIPGWLAALTGLFTALSAGVLVKSGIRARKHEA